MRKALVAFLLTLAALPAGSATSARAEPPVLPLVPRACTPEGPLDVQRPAGCQRILYRYGPLHVTPGDNLILFGPVTVEKPAVPGYVVRFKPNMTLADGSVPGIEVIHLHHAVWFTGGLTATFASGEEKTIISFPNGYGFSVKPTDAWVMNYMLHNQTPVPYDVFITYDIDFIPSSDPSAASIKPVLPHWLDVGSFNGFNPIYNTQRGYGAVPGECSFPKERCAAFDPYGKSGQGQVGGNGTGQVSGMPSGTIVFMAGHVHPGGLRTDVELMRGAKQRRVFTSRAVYYDPNGPVSWDMSMQATRPDYRLRIQPGDKLVLNSVYETTHASWYEGMGIVILFYAPGDDSGTDAFAVDPDDVAVTHGHMPEADNHGGPDAGAIVPALTVNTSTVGIGGFLYGPGDLTTGMPVMPVVSRGTPLQFVNLDAAAQIFHTVTACKAPCNGATGISYPLANGPTDFDSLELGYGPPSATAAANKLSYTLNTAPMNSGLYTYFCRVHPFMRGAFEIR